MRKPEIIVATDADFAVMHGARVVASAVWDDVVEVRAYKRDELTTDLICLDVKLRDGTVVFLHEDAPGWEDVLAAAERALPSMRPFREWFAEVAHPAFAKNEAIIFRRADVAV